MHPITCGWSGSSPKSGFKGKHKIQDHWKKTIYWVDRQQYAGGLQVFRMAPVEGKDKVKVVHQNLLLPFGSSVKDSEDKEGQQDVNGLSDCIQTVSDDGKAETKVVSIDPEPKGEGYASHVQHIQTVYEQNYWVNTISRLVKSLFWYQ